MTKRSEDRDMKLALCICGVEHISECSVHIENSYLEREAMENRKEAGYPVPEKWIARDLSEQEKEEYRHTRMLEALEFEWCQKEKMEYDGGEDITERTQKTKSVSVEII